MRRIGPAALLFTVGVLVSLAFMACAPSADVLFDVHTDLTPVRDFDTVRVAVGETNQMRVARADEPWITGVRIGPILSAVGRQSIAAELLLGGRVVVSRNLSLSVTGTVVIPVYLLRSCVNVECPGTGDRSLTECQDGECVLPTCVEDSADSCPAPSCTVTADCPTATVACAEARCLDGHCLISTPVGGCPIGFACDVEDGCVLFTPPDAGVPDAGTPDTSFDATGFDAALPDVPAPPDTPGATCRDPCDDGNPCSYGDRCVGDSCEGFDIDCVSDECTDRNCNGTSSCTEIIRNGRPCSDDGDPCTDDRCGAGGNCRHNDLTDTACPGGTCCAGTCTAESSSNCGGCGVRCGAGESCSGGSCLCGGATCGGASPACCGGSCSDLDSDYRNCGGCGAPLCGDQFGDCIGGSCICGVDGRCSGGLTCCRCGPGGAGSYCEAPGLCPC